MYIFALSNHPRSNGVEGEGEADMNAELIPHLEAIAKIMNMAKINERYYKGEHGTLFKMTSFGFKIANHEDLLTDKLHPKHK